MALWILNVETCFAYLVTPHESITLLDWFWDVFGGKLFFPFPNCQKFPFSNCQIFLFQTVKISFFKLSKFSFFQTVKISIFKLSKFLFSNCQIFFFKLSKFPFSNCQIFFFKLSKFPREFLLAQTTNFFPNFPPENFHDLIEMQTAHPLISSPITSNW